MKTPDTENKKARILMIDDDVNFCRIYKSLLEDTDNYCVTTAHSGNEGLAMTRNQSFDVILIDIMMPALDGADVANMLSGNEATKNIPCIFVTSLIKPHENLINNRHHYLGKPIYFNDLTSTIELVRANGKSHAIMQAAH